ncbi:MAG: sulfurtransferase [Nitrospira sp.]|nr:sulfurtransferase [Nitrospira sp.]
MFKRSKLMMSVVAVMFLVSLFAGLQSAQAGSLVDAKSLKSNIGSTKPVYVQNQGEDPKTFAGKHIAGSTFLDLGGLMGSMGMGTAPNKEVFEATMGSLGIKNDDNIVLYGAGMNPFVYGAYWTLKYFGHDKVSILDGGLGQWEAAGGATTGDASAITASTYKAAASNDSLRADADHILSKLNDKGTVLVDARMPDEFNGTNDMGMGLPRNGHIPGAVHLNFFPSNMNGDLTIRSAADLKATYEAAGVTADKEVIAYCMGGIRAANTFFVLNSVLGYPNVKVYVGSIGEWANLDAAKYPLAK